MKVPIKCHCNGVLLMRGDLEPVSTSEGDSVEEMIVCDDCGQAYRAYYILAKVVKLEEKAL